MNGGQELTRDKARRDAEPGGELKSPANTWAAVVDTSSSAARSGVGEVGGVQTGRVYTIAGGPALLQASD